MNFQESPRRHRIKAEINVVPYIDVLFVLLIIFMVTIPLMNQSVDVDLPRASDKLTDQITSIPIILTVDQDNNMSLNVNTVSKEFLAPEDVVQLVAAHLKLSHDRNEIKSVMLRADNALDYQNILNAIMLLKQAGALNVGLMTNIGSKIA